ncbi:protein eva-1 homolog C isoform X1 [Amia ocellicauda]|uniref:protein eva-1 homolog C isoform X1 n=2 Tax=Amia ocellicauda TaxID=2972642 RepID=UPI003463AFCA
MFVSDVSSPAFHVALLLGITCLSISSSGCAELFPGHLSRALRNYSEQACDGEYLSVRCPPRTTISIQSSFYGQRAQSQQQCPSHSRTPSTPQHRDGTPCSVSTSLQKMWDECQDRRSCHMLVNSRLFGPDPCPRHSKHLTVWYKCRPNEYKSKVVCEGQRMRLSCRRSTVIAVYSALFGHSLEGRVDCPHASSTAPAIECQSSRALPVVMTWCHGRRSCSVNASPQEFGDPCYSGVRKHLHVIYTCVPKKLLEENHSKLTSPQQPQSRNPNVIGDSAPPDGPAVLTSHSLSEQQKKRVRESGSYSMGQKPLWEPADDREQPMLNHTMESRAVGTQMALISNVMAAYTYISEHPERAALCFVGGVCLGLVLTLCALVVQISCRTDCRTPLPQPRPRRADSDSGSSDSDSDWDSSSDLSARRHRRFERTLNMNVFTSAEELERAQRLEERERIIREIWMNGQPDIPGTRSLNRYY